MSTVEKILFYIKNLAENFRKHDVFFYSSALSFQIVLCLIPTVFLIVLFVSAFLSRETIIRGVESIVISAFPRDVSASAQVKALLLNRTRLIVRHQNLVGIISVVGLLWTSLGLLDTLRKTILHILNLHIAGKWIVLKLYDLRALLIAGFFLTSSILITMFFTFLREITLHFPAGSLKFTFVRTMLPQLSAFGLTFLLYFSIYRFHSFGKLDFASAAFGSFWASVFFELSKDIFAVYLTKIANLWEVYGALETVVALLIWIFFSTVIFIIGIEVALIYSERRTA
ncbi:MAG: YihY/virulence factor BrkB family protein [Candidatus Kryptoniota bacterium]